MQGEETYRVEGIARKGHIRHVKVVGRPGAWSVFGPEGLCAQVGGRTVQDAVRMAKRRIGFHPVVIRKVDPAA